MEEHLRVALRTTAVHLMVLLNLSLQLGVEDVNLLDPMIREPSDAKLDGRGGAQLRKYLSERWHTLVLW
jgi:hypothetical protein